MESGSSNNKNKNPSFSSGSTTTKPTLKTLFNFDLNKTPLPSPSSPTNDDVADLIQTHEEPTMVVCVVCVKHFLENPLSEQKKAEEESEWLCGECSMKCHRRKNVKRSFKEDYKIGGVFDMNASPPSEADGDDVASHLTSREVLIPYTHIFQLQRFLTQRLMKSIFLRWSNVLELANCCGSNRFQTRLNGYSRHTVCRPAAGNQCQETKNWKAG